MRESERSRPVFLAITGGPGGTEDTSPFDLVVVLNWFEELLERVPVS
ncbi:MAG: hypothetical protein QF681_05255 [Vicinamibacterales bacterium]|jgi:hypothetical protein|nr:hypothetical protein [Vicinamibacterales bacterium]